MPQFSRRAMQAGRRRLGLGGGGLQRGPLPNFNAPQAGGGAGYGGVDDILAFINQNGINQSQFQNLSQGYTGGNGYAVGGAQGRFAGLSPWAANWLTTSGVLQKKAADQTSLDGLEGDALWRTQLMNSLAQQNADANPMYGLRSGVDQGFLEQMFGMGFGGHSAYAKGNNAEGRIPGFGNGGNGPRPFKPPIRRRRGRGATPPIKVGPITGGQPGYQIS